MGDTLKYLKQRYNIGEEELSRERLLSHFQECAYDILMSDANIDFADLLIELQNADHFARVDRT